RQVFQVAPEALRRLAQQRWPGNVRELRNVLERAVILATGPVLEPQNFDTEADAAEEAVPALGEDNCVRVEVGTTVGEAERLLILKTLASENNNKTRSAERLGISLKTLQNKLKEYASRAGGA
ncbi:MAG: helix-turn-helix domain-containing protein, partial [Terriglobales bacterium]